MSLINAKLNLKLDRDGMRFEVLPTSTRIVERDANISLSVTGWTLEEVTKDEQGKTPYEPFLRLKAPYSPIVVTEAKLVPDDNPQPEEDGTYAMRGVLSTNTGVLVRIMAGYGQDSALQFSGSIFSETSPNPIASGYVNIYGFGTGGGHVPCELPSASDVLESLRTLLEAHTSARNNPHGITAEQVGALTQAQGDARYALAAYAEELRELVDAANNAIFGINNILETHSQMIVENRSRLMTKADTISTYRKDETYNRFEIDERIGVSSARHLLGGKTFETPTNARGWYNLLAYVVRELGGNITVNGVIPGVTPNAITLAAEGDGTDHQIKIVKSDGEYTTIVR